MEQVKVKVEDMTKEEKAEYEQSIDFKIDESESVTKALQEVYKVYKGMTGKYETIVRGYHKILENKNYSDDFKLKQFDEYLYDAMKLKKELGDEALKLADKVETKFIVQAKKKVTPTDTEQLKNIMLWTSILPTLEKEELREVYAKHRENDEFLQLLKSIIHNDNTKQYWVNGFEASFNSVSPMQEIIEEFKKKIRGMQGMGDSIYLVNADTGKTMHVRNVPHDLRTFSPSIEFKI